MKPRIIGVNGLHNDGSESTDIVLKIMADEYDYDVVDFYYDEVNVLTSCLRSKQQEIGKKLHAESQSGDVVLAHSFGALLTLRAMEQGAEFSTVMFLSAAMHDDVTFPHHGMQRLINVSNSADLALWAAKWMRWGDLGALGCSGYEGPRDERIVQKWSYSNGDGCLNHMHYFKGEYPHYFAKLLNANIQGN